MLIGWYFGDALGVETQQILYPVQHSPVQYSSPVRYSAVLCSTALYSTVHYLDGAQQVAACSPWKCSCSPRHRNQFGTGSV